jgi:PAS domain S-box-containing protein
MPSKTTSTAVLRAVAAIARWLPTAPTDAASFGAACTACLAVELPDVSFSLALRLDNRWQVWGIDTPTVQRWTGALEQNRSGPVRPVRSAGTVLPRHSARYDSLRMHAAFAVWNAGLTTAAFDTLAAQIGAALATLHQRKEHAVQPSAAAHEQAAIQRIAHELNTTLNLDLVLQAVLREVLAVTHATSGAIALPRDDAFRYVITSGCAPDVATALHDQVLGHGQSLADHALRHGQPIVAATTSVELPGFAPEQLATLEMPIRYQERVVGLISLRAAPHQLSTRQLGFMRIVAEQAAIAIGNAQHVAEQMRQRELLQQRANVLNEVLEVGHLLRADRPLNETLVDIAYGISNAVGFRVVIINLRSTIDPALFNAVAFAGVLPNEAERLRNAPTPATIVDALCDARWQISSSYLIVDRAADAIFGHDLDRLTTTPIEDERSSGEWQPTDMFITPLHNASNEVIGFVSVDDPFDRRRPTRRTAEAIEIFANQATIAIQNVELYREAQQQLHRQNTLNRLQHAISASLDVRRILREVYAGLKSALELDSYYSVVYYHDSTTRAREVCVDEGEWSETDLDMRHQRGLHGYMMRSRTPLRFNDLRTDGAALPEGVRPVTFGNDTRSSAAWMGVPLIAADNEVIGALSVHSYTPRRYGPHEHEFLQAVAHQVALSLQNARLFAERERQMAQVQTLNNVGQVASSSLDLNDLFQNLHAELAHYRPIDTLLLSLCDPDTATLEQVLTIDLGVSHRFNGPSPIRPDSYTGRIMRTGEPLLIHDARAEKARYGIVPLLIGDGRESLSLVCVPLRNTLGQTFGMLSMQSYHTDEYDQRDVDFLSSVATQIALNIQNATLFRQTQQQVQQLAAETERLELINRVANWSNGTLDIREVFQRTVNEMAQVTHADQARLLLLDRERGLAICQAELHDTGLVGKLALPIAGNPAIEWFDQHGGPLLVRNALDDPRFAPAHDLWRADNIQDVLIVPLMAKGEVIGSVGLDAQARELNFTERDVATCETIANQVAIAIENARLWKATQQSVRELTLLYDLSVSLKTMLDLEEILATLVTAAQEMQRADLGAVVLVDTLGRLTHFVGLTSAGDELSADGLMHNAALQGVLRSGAALALDATAAASCPYPEHAITSAMIVPIAVKGQTVGALTIGTHAPRSWTDREQSLLTILTSQAASAIENAHLFHSEQEKRRIADTLRDVSMALTSTLKLDEVLRIVMQQLGRIVPYDRFAVLMLRDDHQLESLVTRDAEDTVSFDRQVFASDDRSAPYHAVLQTRQPSIVADLRSAYPLFQQQQPDTPQVRSWLGVPLLHHNELMGLIALATIQADRYTTEMADLAFTIATQAAQAIAHARLFEQIQRFNAELEEKVAERTAALSAEKDRLEALHTITTTLTASLDIDEIVVKTLDLAAGAIGVQRGSVLIRDPLLDQLFFRAVLTESEGLKTLMEPLNLPPGNLVQRTLEQQRGLVVNDVRNDPRWVNGGSYTSDIRSFIAVPLLAADVPLGVLMLNSTRTHYFNDEHLRLLSTIANEVAIAVHNAELYNFINEQATRLAELLQLQREETGKNRAILESVAEGVLVLDEQDVMVLYNRAATQVLRLPETSILGETLDRIAEYGTDDEEHQRALLLYDTLAEGVRNARRQADPIHSVVELPGQTIDATFAPVTTPDGDRIGIAAVLRDITREIEADKAKRMFISTVSHELRTPLTSVKGYVDLMLLGTVGPVSDMQRNFLQIVKSNADRLNGLVEDLLEISRLENGKVTLNRRPLDLPALLDDILASLRTETERKRMTVELDIEPTLPQVEADGKRVGQVLTNLLSNAHKYTRDGGTITVRAFVRDTLLQVDVADTGVGIPADELPNMFSRFFRSNNALKDEVGGTGLGLSIAKSFVELHGGDMWVESVIDVGSTFSFTLPLTPDADTDAPIVVEAAYAS